MTSFLSMVSGRPTMTPLPVRSVGFIEPRIRVGTLTSSLLEYDGYWVVLTSDTFRTIGNASSNANTAAAWTQNLFVAIWNNFSQADCPVLTSAGASTSRGANALADFNANRRINLPELRGRAMVGAGSVKDGDFAPANPKTVNIRLGVDSFQMSPSQMPPHNHRVSVSGNAGNTTFAFINALTAGGGAYLSSSGGNNYIENTGGSDFINLIQSSFTIDIWMAAGAR